PSSTLFPYTTLFRSRLDRITLLAFSRRGSSAVSGSGAIGSRNRFDQTSLELHPETQAELLQFVFDLVERLLAEVTILEHFAFGLLRELANGGDVGVVQAVSRANAQLNFFHAHVEQLLALHVLFAHARRRLVELDYFLVEVDEDVEVVA